MTSTTEERELDIGQYFRNLVRWWWLLVLGAVGGGLTAFLLTGGGVPVYEANAKVLVQGTQSPGITSASDLVVSEQLADAYGQIIKTRSVMEKASERLSFQYSPDALSDTINIISSGSVIVIQVRDPDPVVAAEIANVTAQVFIEDFRERQLIQIARFQGALRQYGIDLDPNVSVAQATMMSIFSILEEARPPGSPITPSTLRNVLVGGILGLAATILVVFVIGYLDDRIKSPEELSGVMGMAVMGSVPLFKNRNGKPAVSLKDEPLEGSMAQAYGFLRTNLGYASLGTQDIKILLVTSSGPKEGKTTTAANLAIGLAREGKNTLLIDLDLRKPTVHRLFDLDKDQGFTNVLLNHLTLEQALQSTQVPRLSVLTSGPQPPDVANVLRSNMIPKIMEEFRQSADIIIVDTPPLLVVPDPLILASVVDGVLMVVDMRNTSRRALTHAADMIGQASLGLVGVVLNKAQRRAGAKYYYSYQYDDFSYTDGYAQGGAPDGKVGLLTRVFRFGKKIRQSPPKA